MSLQCEGGRASCASPGRSQCEKKRYSAVFSTRFPDSQGVTVKRSINNGFYPEKPWVPRPWEVFKAALDGALAASSDWWHQPRAGGWDCVGFNSSSAWPKLPGHCWCSKGWCCPGHPLYVFAVVLCTKVVSR